ncbi:uncharacterized protein LOC143236325 [Tachypleus tridentatus]|uniref:uncharacterized protein LOC143236325 n=1 Tax=Tachypleus tridentatus TaxID=6853 RepID=UPI003FCFF68E
MLSANMMSFVKKIVKTGTEEESERPVEVTKLRQVATGVQDWKGSDRTPRAELERLTTEERSIIERVWQKEEEFEKETKNVCMGGSSLMLRQTSSADQETCRICRKTIGGDEQRRQCDECKQAVCEDCASYSNGSKTAHQQWKCSFCRRRSQRQYRLGLEPPPGAGMQRVPSVRRMTQKMRHLGRERSVTVPELSLDLEGTIGLDGGPSKGLQKRGSGSFAEEPERSFSLDDREPPDQRREKNHVHKPRGCLDFRRPVDRQTSTECSRDSVKVRGDKRSGPRDFFPERTVISCSGDGHLSLDRKSSFEDGRDPKDSLSLHGPYTGHQHQKDLLQQHQFSNSDSSVDEFYHEEAEDRRRANRIRKRSRIQRQKFYVEEPDSDSTLSRPEPLTGGDASPRTFDGSVKTFDKWRWQATPQTADKASPAATSRQHSSDSSDFGDVSGEISPLSDRSGRSERYDRCYVSERLGVISHIKVQKSRIRTTVFNKDPSGNLNSSPSPDEHEIGHSQTDKSFSLEDQEVFSYSTMAMRRSIPSVLVDTVADVGPSTRLYPPNEETHRRHSTGRALPRVPVPENQLGVQPVEKYSTHSLDLPRDETRKPERRASAPERENIKIVVDEVGDTHKTQPKPQLKKVRLHRDTKDARALTRGFGMRVLGGKSAEDGSLYTIISWVRTGGPAEQKGIHQGDKVVEWGGTSLINKTFEEVSAIIERTGDIVEVVVEQHDTRTGEDPLSSHHQKAPVSPRRKQCPTLSLSPDATSDVEIQPISPTRRKLPKTPVSDSNRNLTTAPKGVVGTRSSVIV